MCFIFLYFFYNYYEIDGMKKKVSFFFLGYSITGNHATVTESGFSENNMGNMVLGFLSIGLIHSSESL